MPPVCQFARSPATDTWNAPSTQQSRCPPRIIANESAWWKYDAPGSAVTGCLPALMRSGSSAPASGAGPMPSSPFSVCRMISRSRGRWLATSVGRPMPRFTYAPFADVARDARGHLFAGEAVSSLPFRSGA